jgi:hypothetical protein
MILYITMIYTIKIGECAMQKRTKKKRPAGFIIRLPREVHARGRELARRENRSISNLYQQAIINYLDFADRV